METKWTPGPWEVVEPKKIGGYYAAGDTFKIVREGSNIKEWPVGHVYAASPNACAHAYMLAAALEMYEALKALHDDTIEYIKINNLAGAEDNHVLRMARAALAKAEGR